MMTLISLRNLASQRFRGQALSMAHLLVTWAEEAPQELASVLANSNLTPENLVASLKLLCSQPDVADNALLMDCIKSAAGEARGTDLLKALCENPTHQLTQVLVAKGMVAERVLENLSSSPEPVLAGLGLHFEEDSSVLYRYGRELTALAAEGAFAELCPRSDELQRLLEVLLRKQKANPILTGSAGVGKTALVELLAVDIVDNPLSSLAKTRIFEISMGKLLAGTQYRGDFEARFDNVMEAVQEAMPAILFIDEIHLLWGAGRAEGAAMDAANLLKPFLARGYFRLIGATTYEEYQRYIVKDEALSRRFQEIRVEAPREATLFKIVQQQAENLSRHHQIVINDTVIQEAIALTDQHLSQRYQPDKTVDLLDSSAVAVRQRQGNALHIDDLLKVLARWTGTPIETLNAETSNNLKLLKNTLKKRVIGQDHAIDKVVSHLVSHRLGLGTSERPLGVFLFTGASGVGKSELARSIAISFFGSEDRLISLDLGEYSDASTINKLIGAPPGYKGSDEEGVLIRGLRRHPSSVILFDELEKAHEDIYRLLLGLLEQGKITSGQGQRVDARQSVIILTSNVLIEQPRSVGFVSSNIEASDTREQLSEHFPREFLNRIDEIIVFNALGREVLRKILKQRLQETQQRLVKKSIHLELVEDMFLDYLLAQLKEQQSGARGIQRLLEQKLLQPIGLILLNSDTQGPFHITLDAQFMPKILK